MKLFSKVQDIRVGVIGYGGAFNMGRQHLRLMQEAGMTPCAVSEIDPSRLKIATEDFPGIETYSSVAQMLKKSPVNLVVIITPHNTHAPLAMQCLKAGKHVVCEKPFAITTRECDAMIQLARKKKCMVSTFHNRHWDGCIVRAVEEIRKGLIGDVLSIEAQMGEWGRPKDWWRSSKKISGGILYDWGAHFLEFAFQIVRSEIQEVTAFSKTGFWAPHLPWKKDSNEDELQAIIRFKGNIPMKMNISTLQVQPRPYFFEIRGTKGTYSFNIKTWETVIAKGSGCQEVTRGNNSKEMYVKFYENIAEHLTRNKPLIITPELARRVIHVLDLADQSAQRGKTLVPKYR